MTRPRLSLLAAALALPLGIGAVVLTPAASADHHQEGGAAVATGNVMAVLEADEQFSTLVGALKASGLDKTLSEEGPFTLFAPNNAAFEKADPEKREAILNSEKRLKKVLLMHVLSGKMTAADLEAAGEVENLAETKPLKITAKNGGITVHNRTVLTADVAAENGVIHIMEESFFPRIKTEGDDAGRGKGKGKGKKKKKGDDGDDDGDDGDEPA